MSYQFSNYSLICVVTASIALVAASAAWRRRSAPGGLALFLMTAAVLEWALADALEASAVGLGDKIFWSKAAYLGAHTSAPLFLLFVLSYTGRQRWLTRRTIALLFAVPVLTILFAATNEWHQLIWTGYVPNPAVPNNYFYLHGVWFWVATVYVNTVLFLGTFLLLLFVFRSPDFYRRQLATLVVAVLFPWVGFALYVLNLSPWPGLDLTAICFAFTSAILVFGFKRLRFLDVVPVAREFLVENMGDGLLVLDSQNRVVDINPAARQLLDLAPAQPWIGQPVTTCLAQHPNLAQCLEAPGSAEWRLEGPAARYFDLRVSGLPNRPNRPTGKIIVFRDITQHKLSEQALQQANAQLAERLDQIEKLKDELSDLALRDQLTGLYNRRYLDELFARELAQAIRHGTMLSVVVLDLDHFKDYNDTCGHLHGDSLLRALGVLLRTQFRRGDVACRYGGDEFIIVMPQSSPEAAWQRLEALRPACQHLVVGEAGEVAQITFSAGIAAYPTHATTLSDLLRVADLALYKAKSLGRNRTCLP